MGGRWYRPLSIAVGVGHVSVGISYQSQIRSSQCFDIHQASRLRHYGIFARFKYKREFPYSVNVIAVRASTHKFASSALLSKVGQSVPCYLADTAGTRSVYVRTDPHISTTAPIAKRGIVWKKQNPFVRHSKPGRERTKKISTDHSIHRCISLSYPITSSSIFRLLSIISIVKPSSSLSSPSSLLLPAPHSSRP